MAPGVNREPARIGPIGRASASGANSRVGRTIVRRSNVARPVVGGRTVHRPIVARPIAGGRTIRRRIARDGGDLPIRAKGGHILVTLETVSEDRAGRRVPAGGGVARTRAANRGLDPALDRERTRLTGRSRLAGRRRPRTSLAGHPNLAPDTNGPSPSAIAIHIGKRRPEDFRLPYCQLSALRPIRRSSRDGGRWRRHLPHGARRCGFS
jgi:hypothetical protein